MTCCFVETKNQIARRCVSARQSAPVLPGLASNVLEVSHTGHGWSAVSDQDKSPVFGNVVPESGVLIRPRFRRYRVNKSMQVGLVSLTAPAGPCRITKRISRSVSTRTRINNGEEHVRPAAA